MFVYPGNLMFVYPGNLSEWQDVYPELAEACTEADFPWLKEDIAQEELLALQQHIKQHGFSGTAPWPAAVAATAVLLLRQGQSSSSHVS